MEHDEPIKPTKVPHHRRYVFAKRCTNDHGHFQKGDRARGAFSDDLVRSYVDAGILVEVSDGLRHDQS